MRFTVGYCLYPHGENNSIETRMRLIFDDGLPATCLLYTSDAADD